MTYLVHFTNRDIIPRWRSIDAHSDGSAIEAALAGLRPGALKRYARRNATLGAYVAKSAAPRHDNGRPSVCQGYRLTLRLDSDCPHCGGTGMDSPHTDRWCNFCAGTGTTSKAA